MESVCLDPKAIPLIDAHCICNLKYKNPNYWLKNNCYTRFNHFFTRAVSLNDALEDWQKWQRSFCHFRRLIYQVRQLRPKESLILHYICKKNRRRKKCFSMSIKQSTISYFSFVIFDVRNLVLMNAYAYTMNFDLVISCRVHLVS
jgi:hypothetical protein